MVVSGLRRWWGSRRLLRFAAGLTFVAVTAGAGGGITASAGGGIAAAEPVGLFGEAISTTASAPAPPAIHGAAGRSAESAGTVAGGHDRVDVASVGELSEHLAASASSQRTAARDDVAPLVGVAYAPSGLRAPPLRLI